MVSSFFLLLELPQIVLESHDRESRHGIVSKVSTDKLARKEYAPCDRDML
jgi:hypothetical protein